MMSALEAREKVYKMWEKNTEQQIAYMENAIEDAVILGRLNVAIKTDHRINEYNFKKHFTDLGYKVTMDNYTIEVDWE